MTRQKKINKNISKISSAPNYDIDSLTFRLFTVES